MTTKLFLVFVEIKKLSKTEREASTKALNDLMIKLGEVEDLKLKEELAEKILALCDQLKSSMVLDKYKGKL